MRVLDAHHAGLDAQNPPCRVAELENVPGHALDGKVFVDGSDEEAFRFENHLIVSIVRDGTAGSDGRQTRAFARPHAPAHAVVVQMRSAAAAPHRKAFGEHVQHFVELFALQVPVRVRAATEFIELINVPALAVFRCRNFGDDLLS